jgi:hypothetical protein
MLALTLSWLTDEGYIRTLNKFDGSASWEKLVLSEKGLRAMNAVPAGLSQPVGSHLINISNGPTAWSQVAEAVGSLLGGFTKSVFGH